jgi:hypothetical protein
MIVVGVPINLKDCYILKEKKIIPTKVIYLTEDLKAMSNFYFSQDGNLSEEQALLLAEEELANLEEVKKFYKGCVFEFDEKDSTNLEMISVSV